MVSVLILEGKILGYFSHHLCSVLPLLSSVYSKSKEFPFLMETWDRALCTEEKSRNISGWWRWCYQVTSVMAAHRSGTTWGFKLSTTTLLVCFQMTVGKVRGIWCLHFSGTSPQFSFLFTGVIRVLFAPQLVWFPATVVSSPQGWVFLNTPVVSALPRAQGLIPLASKRDLRSFRFEHQVAFGAGTALTSCADSDNWSCVPVLRHPSYPVPYVW